jgi:hypothetical protein
MGSIAPLSPTARLTTYFLGTYEANAARFIGFSFSTLLSLSLVALACDPAFDPTPSTSSPPPPPGPRRREIPASVLGLALLAAGALAARAPSGAFIATITAAALALPLLLSRGRSQREPTSPLLSIERSLATICAVLLAIAVGYSRIEAREAVLWGEQPTRADRALEIIAAHAERTATGAIAVACLAAAVILSALEITRAPSPSLSLRAAARRSAPLLIALAVCAAADAAIHLRFVRTRDALRAALAPQFSLFSRLDPPLAGAALDTPAFTPHVAPAAQLTRDIVAINGRGVARLAAMRSAEGAINIGRDLNHALAGGETEGDPQGAPDPAVERAIAANARSSSAPDLSIAVDREIDYATLLLFLRIARSSGVERAEILLTRGRPPVLPVSAPPEAGYVLAGDFAAVPIKLADQGFRAPDGDRFDVVARALATEASARGGEPVILFVPAPDQALSPRSITP